jgi:hypothetical protein
MFKRLLVLSLLIINVLAVSAQFVDANYKSNQPRENSPMSRFGFGDISPQFLASNAGFGGMTAAYRDRYNYNPYNPASLAALRMTAFEIGLYGSRNTVKTNAGSAQNWGGNLHYLALGFPTYSVINEVLDRKPRAVRWSMGLNLLPYSITSYNSEATSKSPKADSVTISNFYVGSGSTYKLMLGNGVSYKGLSAGVNAGLLFGRNTYIRQSLFSANLLYPYINYFNDFHSIAGFTWNAGAQYDITIGKAPKTGEKDTRKHIVLGVYGNPEMKFTTLSNRSYERVYQGPTQNVFAPNDTIESFTGREGSGTLPSELTMGVMYENGLKFRGGVEYKTAGWSNYKNDANPQVLKNSGEFTVGAEFILGKSRLKTDEEKVRWRLGFRTGTDPRSLNNEQVKTWAATAGMCLPLRVGRGQQLSYMNLGLEYGALTTKALTQDYIRLNLGFTLNDNTWFLKKKYN